jgi:Tfp pilus assembly protein PilN
MTLTTAIPRDVRKLLAFGAGVGIEIAAADLEVAAARVRPSRIQVAGRLTIRDFATRPAAEWGAEYHRFLKALGMADRSATVLLPRREVIVRQVALPGVAPKDLESALGLQLDTLHPYGDDEVVWGWSPLEHGAVPVAVLVGIVRRSVIDRYVQLFSEAGIAAASFTFSAAAVHAAIRLNGGVPSGPGGHPQGGFIALSRGAAGGVEVYGESPARPVFSAEFDLPPERAAILALSELRLPPDTAPRKLEEVLPSPAVNPVENDLSRNALPYATALAGACPWLAPAANVLPVEYRRFSSHRAFFPTVVLAGLLLLVGGGMALYANWSQRQYLKKLDAEIARLQPRAERAAALDRAIDNARARTQLLDQFRGQTPSDLGALNELTRLIEPPAWTNSISLTRDSVRLSGEAPQAAPLLKVLDSSPLFTNTTPDLLGRSNSGSGETFQIHSSRRAGK